MGWHMKNTALNYEPLVSHKSRTTVSSFNGLPSSLNSEILLNLESDFLVSCKTLHIGGRWAGSFVRKSVQDTNKSYTRVCVYK